MSTLLERYEIYVKCATDLDWDIMSFDEWLDAQPEPQPSIPSPFLRLAFQKALKKLNSDPKTKSQK